MARGAVITDNTRFKSRKGSNSKPTMMLSQLPLLLTDVAIHSILLIAAGYNMLGVSRLSAQCVILANIATGTGAPKELDGHGRMGT
jgi:hypothetical protein